MPKVKKSVLARLSDLEDQVKALTQIVDRIPIVERKIEGVSTPKVIRSIENRLAELEEELTGSSYEEEGTEDGEDEEEHPTFYSVVNYAPTFYGGPVVYRRRTAIRSKGKEKWWATVLHESDCFNNRESAENRMIAMDAKDRFYVDGRVEIIKLNKNLEQI